MQRTLENFVVGTMSKRVKGYAQRGINNCIAIIVFSNDQKTQQLQLFPIRNNGPTFAQNKFFFQS
jgi:hypothetical protein